ncbi:hypothetical protein MKX01_035133 [Papaver californicum]|nr:hypothetical protein MKX01_035133 [Papaver californicum]
MLAEIFTGNGIFWLPAMVFETYKTVVVIVRGGGGEGACFRGGFGPGDGAGGGIGAGGSVSGGEIYGGVRLSDGSGIADCCNYFIESVTLGGGGGGGAGFRRGLHNNVFLLLARNDNKVVCHLLFLLFIIDSLSVNISSTSSKDSVTGLQRVSVLEAALKRGRKVPKKGLVVLGKLLMAKLLKFTWIITWIEW